MPTYGLRPDDLVRDSRGDVAIDLKQTFYATRTDAETQANPLGTATSAKDGKWQFTTSASGVFGRDPEGNIRFYDSEEPKLSELGVVTTKRPGALSALAFQNKDATSGDSGTRIYIVPKASVTSGVGGVLKIFGDDYSTDQTNYRDMGLYFSQNQNGETGTRGDGCFYINIKTNGTKAGVLPDLVFSMQDGTGVVARMSSPIVGGQSKYTMVVGPGQPEHSKKRAMVLEVQGDMGFDGAADRSIYWETTGGVSSNVLTFERTASNGNLRLKLGGSQKALFTGSGDLVLGDNSADLSTASTVGFLHMRSIAGTPSTTPTTYAGAVPLVIDPTGSKMWAYMGGAWKSVTFA